MTERNESPRKLRIVHTESSAGWGGQELRILAESQGMLSRGHDVRIVCPQRSTICEAAHRRGIPVETLQIERRNLNGFHAVRRWLHSREVDVINTHSATDSWLFSLAVKLLRRRPAMVRTRHIGAPVSRDLWTRWLYTRGADLIVSCGERLRQTLVKYNGFPEDHVFSVPTGIDTGHFVPGDRLQARRGLGLPPEKTIIGIIAALRGGKGHRYLLEAVHRLERDDLYVVIVGEGVYRTPIQEDIAELSLSEKVHMAGHREDVVRWLQAIDIFALPSVSIEGVPQSIMQAMSCELPVVATSIGSIEDAVSHRQTGWIVPPRDSHALAEALDALTRDDQLRRQLGREGRRVAVARLGVDRMLDRMEDVFQRVVAKAA